MDLQGILIAIVGGVFAGGGVAGIITARAGARRSEVDTLRATLEELRTENTRLQTRVSCLETAHQIQERDISDLRIKVANLQTENYQLSNEVSTLKRENKELRALLAQGKT
jgi:chromosome segregation ATPase